MCVRARARACVESVGGRMSETVYGDPRVSRAARVFRETERV